jgi:hypothetical protein
MSLKLQRQFSLMDLLERAWAKQDFPPELSQTSDIERQSCSHASPFSSSFSVLLERVHRVLTGHSGVYY